MVGVNRFQGALLGVLLGDCLGAPFEGLSSVTYGHLNKYFTQLNDTKLRLPFKPFTDDTAMTKSVALSLIHSKGFDPFDMAKRFVSEYLKEPKRGYGGSIGQVFMRLRQSKFEDPYLPAQKQFEGMGSYGNGAAMRITPIALYTHPSNVSKLINEATLCSKITHSNKWGYRGAILQALAVRQALNIKPDGAQFDVIKFVDDLLIQMSALEEDNNIEDDLVLGDPLKISSTNVSYVQKLEIVKGFLSQSEQPSLENVQEKLGVSVSAPLSVPTAIYCFLAAQKPLREIETDNSFQRCIQYAFSLGGDTDTIGSMAGAISGAHLGLEGISPALVNRCEGVNSVLKWAEDLHILSLDLAGQPQADAEAQGK